MNASRDIINILNALWIIDCLGGWTLLGVGGPYWVWVDLIGCRIGTSITSLRTNALFVDY